MLSRHALLSKREAPTAFSALIVTRCCTSAVFVLGMYCQALVLVGDFAAACVMVLFGKMNFEHLAHAPAPPELQQKLVLHNSVNPLSIVQMARTGVEKI